MIEAGILLLCISAFFWTTVTLSLKVRRHMHDGICGCGHNISFHLTPGNQGSKCKMRTGYGESNLCGCQRFVPRTNPTTAMIEAATRELG